MPDINITVTIPDAKTALVRDALDFAFPKDEGETEGQRAKRFLRESVIAVVHSYQTTQARQGVTRDNGVAT